MTGEVAEENNGLNINLKESHNNQLFSSSA
jgi:hypothetical protein